MSVRLIIVLVLTALLLSGCGAQSHLTVRGEGITAPLSMKLAEKAANAHSSHCEQIGAVREDRRASVQARERKGLVEGRYVVRSDCTTKYPARGGAW